MWDNLPTSTVGFDSSGEMGGLGSESCVGAETGGWISAQLGDAICGPNVHGAFLSKPWTFCNMRATAKSSIPRSFAVCKTLSTREICVLFFKWALEAKKVYRYINIWISQKLSYELLGEVSDCLSISKRVYIYNLFEKMVSCYIQNPEGIEEAKFPKWFLWHIFTVHPRSSTEKFSPEKSWTPSQTLVLQIAGFQGVQVPV